MQQYIENAEIEAWIERRFVSSEEVLKQFCN